MASLKKPFDVAVITTTILRPSLRRAIQSVFDQDYQGRIQILVGVDRKDGDPGIIEELRQACPDNITLTVIDTGYSTARQNGGIYTSFSGGSMRTVLSYAANSRLIAYLDDDNWFAPTHLSDLLQAVQGNAWAYSLRWLVDKESQKIICEDDFISVGAGKGIFAKVHGGFVDTNCLIMDKLQFHNILPLWCIALVEKGNGADQRISQALMKSGRPCGFTGRPSVYYEFLYKKYPIITKFLRQKGVIE